MHSVFHRSVSILRGDIEAPSFDEAFHRSLHAARFWASLPVRRADAQVLYCYPEKPMPIYTLWPVSRAANLVMRKGTGSLTAYFIDKEVVDPASLPPEHTLWINGRCTDISKNTVARIYEEVFGNSFRIDPRTHVGSAVKKFDAGNGKHDGCIVKCPVENVELGYAYQKLVDNEVPGKGVVEDLRANIVGNEIVLVYIKHRPLLQRFSNGNSSVKVVDTNTVFRADEITKILQFTQKIGLDFGDIDVLRDRHTQELYIVDVNSTSVTPPIFLSYTERLACIRRISDAFRRAFVDTH